MERDYSFVRVQKIRRSSLTSASKSNVGSVRMNSRDRLFKFNNENQKYRYRIDSNNQLASSFSKRESQRIRPLANPCKPQLGSAKQSTEYKKNSRRHDLFSSKIDIPSRNNSKKTNWNSQCTRRRCCCLLAALLLFQLLAGMITAMTIMGMQLKNQTTYGSTQRAQHQQHKQQQQVHHRVHQVQAVRLLQAARQQVQAVRLLQAARQQVQAVRLLQAARQQRPVHQLQQHLILVRNYLRWNQTGTIVAGTTLAGSTANQLNEPYCLYIDSNDILYVCDYLNHRIQKWLPNATNGTTIAGSSTGLLGSSSLLLYQPFDLTFDVNGYLYVADSGNARVQRFPPNSLNGTSVAGTGFLSSALNGLNHPTAIIVDNNLNLFVLDEGNTRLMKWLPNATNGSVMIDANDLNSVFDFVFAPGSSNQVYLSDNGASKVRLWTFSSSTEDGYLQIVNASTTTITSPRGLAYDPYGNLYVADTLNDRIVMFCGNSTVGTVVAKYTTGVPTVSGPSGVAFDSNLNLYVSNLYSDNVVAFARL
ncbi:unnamed protein product [Adineta ricciae]|uniref:NHL repeat containing protein n=1 Tax=Adineta ricciae TaxID=249248 RepID=A0A816DCZ3_ADIRI|nr:unnamed protein product [Adineta ricciae]